MKTRTILLFALLLAIGSPAGAATVARYANVTQGGVNALETPADIGDTIEIVIFTTAPSAGGTIGFSIDVECSTGGVSSVLGFWAQFPVLSVVPFGPCGQSFAWSNATVGFPPVLPGYYLSAFFTVPECALTTCGDGYIDIDYNGTLLGGAPAPARLPVIVQTTPDSDFGDAPHPYPTLDVNDGAVHKIEPNLYLGREIDAEVDGWPSAGADGDDANGIDDEDGVEFLTRILLGDAADVNVAESAAGLLDAWLDFNIDGDWLDPGEQIFTSYPLNPGGNIITFNVPTEAIEGDSYARFRFSTSGGLDPNGPAEDGEVEDYRVFIEPCPCMGDINRDGKNSALDMTLLLIFLWENSSEENRWQVPMWDGIIVPDGYECMDIAGGEEPGQPGIPDTVLGAKDMTAFLIHLFIHGARPENDWTADFCYNSTFRGL